MKTKVFWMLLIATWTAPALVHGQNEPAAAAAIADQRDAEERYRLLTSRMEGLETAIGVLRRQIDRLTEENRRLREEASKPAPAYVTRDDLAALVKQFEEIDKKREADKKMILDEIEKILKSSVSGASLKPPAPNPGTEGRGRGGEPPPSTPAYEGPGFWHEVADTDGNLSRILGAYNEVHKMKTTLEQVQAANPGLDPDKIRIGQKIFIPDTSK